MTTKSSLCKQVIIPISSDNIKIFIESSGNHIANINRLLKSIKLDTYVNYIHNDHQGLITITNKVSSQSNMNTVENYIKNIQTIDISDIQTAYLSQSKSYLKILEISYFVEGTNTAINLEVVKFIIKSTHVFENIHIASQPHVIKVSFKLDMTIIWIDIWDSQNRSSAKTLINHCFNIGSHIATIHGANMNPSVFQYKNC